MRARPIASLSVALTLVACASATPAPVAPLPTPSPVVTPPAPDADAAVAPQDAAVVVQDAPPAAPVAEADAAVAPQDAAVAAPASADGPVRMFRGRSEDEWIREITNRSVVRVVERFHSTLFVYRIDLGDGIEISFQPEQAHLESFWRREIASYHLARILGISERVPPTVSKRIPLRAFGRLANGAGLTVDDHGMVIGSASVWMPTLHGAQMHTPEAVRVWRPYVDPAVPLPSSSRERERARQTSEVLVFDYLAANYDRWNCCNITVDEHNDLVFRDNDAGWLPNVIGRLGSPGIVRRVPRYLWESIQRATPEALRASVERDPIARTHHIIPEESYPGYERRRQALMSSLRRTIQRFGESNVLAWP